MATTSKEWSEQRYNDDVDALEEQAEQGFAYSSPSETLSYARAKLPRRLNTTSCFLCAVYTFLIATMLIYRFCFGTPSLPSSLDTSLDTLDSMQDFDYTLQRDWTLDQSQKETQSLMEWQVPSDTKVVGIVFFGRRVTASLLDCYLQRNLKRNGGVLDEVVWIQGTVSALQVEWLDYIVNNTEGYSKYYNNEFARNKTYGHAYSVVFEEKHEGPVVYVKIDDDIVFIEDIAVKAIVQRLLTDPHRPLLVGANVVNQAALSWVHFSMNAVDSYLPELPEQKKEEFEKNNGTAPTPDVQPEPYWKGPADYTVPKEFTAEMGHRWLPLDPKGPMTFDNTPIAIDPVFYPHGDALHWWPIGAQQHYSLLGRLERNALDALKFDVWNFNYVRMGIQFFAILREDIVERYPFPPINDERYLSMQATRQAKRPGYVDGRNVVSHYSYGPQGRGMGSTDILQRYRRFAEQGICATLDNIQKADAL